MAISAQRIVVRTGMSQQIPALVQGEMGWDVDLHRLRVGDGSSTPTIIMSNKSIGAYTYNFIDYVQFPEIRMLPDGTVDGVDISDLNAANGFVVRRGDNLWAHRSLTNTDGNVQISNPAGTAGNPVINFSTEILTEIHDALHSVAVDNETIHGNGRPEAPLYAHTANTSERGVVRLSNNNETIDGFSDSIAVTPASLTSRTATFDRTGLIRKATYDEVLAGNSTDAAVSPAYLRSYTSSYVQSFFDANGSQLGWARGPDLTDGLGLISTADVTNYTGILCTVIVNGGTSGGSGEGQNPSSPFVYVNGVQIGVAATPGTGTTLATTYLVIRSKKTGIWWAGNTALLNVGSSNTMTLVGGGANQLTALFPIT